MKLSILHLYPREMNIYGDHGNLLTLVRRMQWRGIEPRVLDHHPGAPLPPAFDIILGGGGQDSAQAAIHADLPHIKAPLTEAINAGTPALTICGTYQLFGNYFQTVAGEHIEGLGIFDLHTIGGEQRLIGNIVTQSERFGRIVGYENHSGKTYLGPGAQPLATVISGAGNNGTDKSEGIHHHHALGTYLHGPLLPKNPAIADYLIATALERRYGTDGCLPLKSFDDHIAHKAAKMAATRPR
jgi:CobQ-like glutamine amidotransferase family enzyme